MNCPRCHKVIEIPEEDKEKERVKCQKCGRDAINEDAIEAAGVRKVDVTLQDGSIVPSYESMGDMWKRFPSWYCLKFFDTLQERVDHDHKHHKIGDRMLGMIPSGQFTEEASCNG